MKRFFRATGMCLSKTFCRGKFWLAVALYIGLLTIISQDLFSEYATVYYIFHYAFANSTSYFLLVICALPNAAVFVCEWSARRFVASYSRTKKFPFASSMIVSSFISAFAVSIIASVLYLAILLLKYPVCGDISDAYFLYQMGGYANGGLAILGNNFLYYFMEFVTQGCLMGSFSALATLFSVILTDPNIAVVMPMILYILITNVMSWLPIPRLLNPYHVYSQRNTVYKIFFPDRTENFSVISMMYPLIYTAVLLGIFVLAAYFMINRKYEKYNDIG
ncbi:MAG: hypothetical protein NC401_09090 [Ruminococcus sp.]|nr:hypothetical protein [Ruminococcus sp.]